ncbi:MAG: 2-oxoacid:acceptor oxidoreductase family protein [bacterium]
MKEEIIFAGFGGQGVMSMGKVLAYAGMKEQKEVSWMPSYGPEMRGGTANCTVVISSRKIASPFSSHPDVVIAMNRPSLDKFEEKIKSGGRIYVNTSMVDREVEREDLEVIKVPANKIAQELGSNKIANMVVLGAYLEASKIVSLETVENSLAHILPEHRHDLIPLNKKALQKGKLILSVK